MKTKKAPWPDGSASRSLCARLLSMLILFLTISLASVSVEAQTTAQAALSWTDIINEASYRVERSDDGGTTYASVGTVAQNVTAFNDTNAGVGLALNTLYCWKIFAINGFGESESTPACAEASTPDTVTNVTVTVSPL